MLIFFIFYMLVFPVFAAEPPGTCDCAFESDITVPDGSVFAPGTRFEKVWRVRNSGNCTWDFGFRLVFVKGEKMGALECQPLPGPVAPGERVDIAVPMSAPLEPGEYTGWWSLQTPDGHSFGDLLFIKIVVKEQAAPAFCLPDSFLVSEKPSEPAFFGGEKVEKLWQVRNSGNCTWDGNYRLVFAGGDKVKGEFSRPLNAPVAPGEVAELSLSLQVPKEPGVYLSRWRMKAPWGPLFGQELITRIVVEPEKETSPLTLADLPPGFQKVSPASLGLKAEDLAFKGLKVESAFGFVKDFELIFGVIFALGEEEQREWDETWRNPAEALEILALKMEEVRHQEVLSGLEGLGEEALGVAIFTGQGEVALRTEIIAFRRGEKGVLLFVLYPAGEVPAISGLELALIMEAHLTGKARPAERAETHPETAEKAHLAPESYREGERLLREGDLNQAIAAFEKAISLSPDLAEAYALLARAHLISGETRLYQLYMERSLDARLRRANSALRAHPQEAYYYYERGNAYLNMGAYDEAIADFTQAISLTTASRAEFHARLALAYNEKGLPEKAIEEANRAIRLDGRCALAYAYRGAAYARIGQYIQAMADLNRALEIGGLTDEERAGIYNHRAFIYQTQGRYGLAWREATRAIELLGPGNPQAARNYALRGQASSGLGDYEQAALEFTTAINLNPADPRLYLFYAQRGLALYALRHYDLALSDLNTALTLNPESAQAYYIRGWVYYDLESYGRAVADFSRAIALNPEYLEAYNGRGLAHFRQGDYQAAIADFARVIALDHRFAEAYFERGMIYLLSGQTEKAIPDLEMYLCLSPEDREGNRARVEELVQRLLSQENQP